MNVIAGQAEILRSVQRDDAFRIKLHDSSSQLVSSIFGPLKWMQWRHYIQGGTNIIYQALTTLGNLQTLGEEYTGIMHWTSENKLPSKERQYLMVLLNCFGDRLILYLISRMERFINGLPEDHDLRPEVRAALLVACDFFREIIPLVTLLHQTIFYFEGSYFHISKRVTGIKYRLIRSWLGDRSMVSTFRLLGVISMLHFLFALYSVTRKLSLKKGESAAKNVESALGAKCSLCLNNRVDTSTTPCGHLFCWECILNWTQEQPICPICRQSVPPSRVVYLQNYGL